MPTLRESLLDANNTGTLLLAIGINLSTDLTESGNLPRELAALHNAGLIDVVAAFEQLENPAAGSAFFLLRHVFEQVLPELDAPVASVAHCAHRLFQLAGQDLMNGTILNAFADFLVKDNTRPITALQLIESTPETFVALLPCAIAATSRLNISDAISAIVRLSTDDNLDIRRRAVLSYSTLVWNKDDKVSAQTFDALELSVASDSDDELLAGAIRAAFVLLKQDRSYEARAVALISTALSKGRSISLHAAAYLFGFHTDELPPALFDALVSTLPRIEPGNRGSLDILDHGLATLLKGDRRDVAIGLIEDILLAHPDSLTLDTLANAVRAIQDDKRLLSNIATRWLLKGPRALCEGVYVIAAAQHIEHDMRIDIDTAVMGKADAASFIFVAHKAIGYFFISPITAASIIISLIRSAPADDVRGTLTDLLVDPLLLNYTGKVRDYIKAQGDLEIGPTKASLDVALARIQGYLEVLQGVPDLAALHPTELQRTAYRRHMNESMATSFKAAERTSIFADLFTRSTLLYGNKSIHYMYGADGTSHRTEMPLGSHGVSIEYPRMDYIDPVGTDYVTRIFRSERWVS